MSDPRAWWERLAKRLPRIDSIGPARRNPDAAKLDRHEKRTKLALPASYRAYCEVFGEGTFCGYFNVHVPGGRLESFQEEASGRKEFVGEHYGAWAERLVPFADTVGGDIVAWDPEVVTRKKDRELAVYVLPRDADEPVRAADTFRHLVERVFLHPDRLGDLLGFVDDGEPLPVDFEPSFRPPGTRAPKKPRLPPMLASYAEGLDPDARRELEANFKAHVAKRGKRR